MSNAVDIALPCRRVTLSLQIAPEDSATTLEDLMARAIALGRRDVDQLAELFVLHDRIIVDVIGTLWSKGFATVDFETGAIDLSDEAREILGRGGSLSAAKPDQEIRKFLFEPITQTVHSEAGSNRAAENSIRVPIRQDVAARDIPRQELISAVQRALRDDRSRGRRANILSVSFGNPLIREPEDIRWLPVRAFVHRDPDSERITVRLPDDDRRWSSEESERLSNYISAVAERQPDLPFIQSLKGRAGVEYESPERTEFLLERMAAKVSGLDSVPRSQVTEQHEVLSSYARRLHSRLDVAARALSEVTVVRGLAGAEWTAKDLIEAAQSQVLLVVPRPRYEALGSVRSALHEAAARGVQIVLIWGRGPKDEIHPKVRTLLDELALTFRASVLVEQKSARIDTCLIVQDDQRALVSSHSPLGDRVSHDEPSLLIEPSPYGPAAPRAVVDMLLWARRTYPSWGRGRQIKWSAEDFNPTDVDRIKPSALEVQHPIRPKVLDENTIRLWGASWRAHYAAIIDARASAATRGAVAELVENSEQREFLWHGLRHAKRRLILTDDRVDRRSATTVMANAIRERKAAGAVVLLAHPSIDDKTDDTAPFRALATGPNRVPVRQGNGNARILIVDDEFMIGSYSPLHDREVGFIDWQTRVAVRIQSENVAAELAAELRAERSAEPSAAVDQKVPVEQDADVVALPLLLEARACGSGSEFGRRVVERLRDVDGPWSVLRAWAQVEVPSHEIKIAAASLIQAGVGSAGEDLEWRKWLVIDAWRRWSFVEGALLCRVLLDHDELSHVAATAMAIELGPVDSLVSDAVLELSDCPVVAAQRAGAAGAIAEALLWGGTEGADSLEVIATSLLPAWQDFADATVQHQRRGGGPVRVAEFDAVNLQLEGSRAIQERRTEVTAAIDRLGRLRQRFDFPTGKALHDALFSADGLMTAIRSMISADAPDWEQLERTLPTEVRAHLDSVIQQAGEPPMAWSRQWQYLRSIENIVRNGRLLANAHIGKSSVHDGPLEGAGTDLAQFIAERWDQLFSEASATPDPYDIPQLAVLYKLAPLRRWANSGLPS